MYSKVRQKRPAPPALSARAESDSVDRDLARAAGSEYFQRRDPLYHITESFQLNFDALGKRHAQALDREDSGMLARNTPLRREQEEAQPRLETERYGVDRSSAGPTPVQTFSKMAFQRGGLSASILAGTGKMMLVSCLRRTVGENNPKKLQEQTVLGIGSQVRNIPQHDPDQMAFNRGFSKSAIGLVVDTLRDARRTVDSLMKMAEGTGELESRENEGTLRRMYPFLDDSREREMISRYELRLAACTDADEKAVYQNALVRTRALIEKKAQMKNEFINKLRFISDRAAEAQSELENEDVRRGILQEVLGTPEETEPDDGGEAPDDGSAGAARYFDIEPEPDEGGTADAPDETEQSPGPEDGETAGPGETAAP